MKTRAKVYIAIVSFVGMAAGLACLISYLPTILGSTSAGKLAQILVPVLVCALCRSLPIPIRDGEELDLSIIGVLAVYLSRGTLAAVFTYFVSTLFTFQPDAKTKKYRHVFHIGPQKLFFNDSTILLSIIIPALLVNQLSPWQPGNLSLPGVIWPMFMFSLLTFFVNGILQVSLFCLMGMMDPRDMALMLVKLLPNVFAAIPLGYLLGMGYVNVQRIWITLLVLMPLLLARYAWKLYLYTASEQSRLVRVLVNSIEAKDKYTQGHSERVSDYSVQIAKQLHLSHRKIATVRQGALLHDVGKISIPDQVLNKPGRLDDEEMKRIQGHPASGEKILEGVGLHPEILRIVRGHHERYDGKGYPDGCKLSEMDQLVRIVGVADAYDAMTSDRPYRNRLPQEVAFANLIAGKGTQFDPEAVDALIASMK